MYNKKRFNFPKIFLLTFFSVFGGVWLFFEPFTLGFEYYLILVFLSLVITLIFIYSRYVKKKRIPLRNIIIGSVKYLLSCNTHWGEYYDSKTPKIANVVEGLLVLIYGDDILTSSIRSKTRAQLSESISFLLSNLKREGFQSISIGKSTIHATAMGLFCLRLAQDKALDQSKISNDKLIELSNCLVKSYSNGWGFLTDYPNKENEVRIFSTIWALRALNLCDSSMNFAQKMEALVRRVPNGQFGFTYNDNPKVAMMSLFLILLSELRDSKLRDEMIEYLGGIDDIIELIIQRLEKGIWIEIEEYSVPSGKLSGIEKLSWTHISIGLALQALGHFKYWLSKEIHCKVNSIIRELLDNHFKDFVFKHPLLKQDKNKPLLYPITYIVVGLTIWHKTDYGGNADNDYR